MIEVLILEHFRNTPYGKQASFASVKIGLRTYHFSRYADERHWMCDAVFHGCLPMEVHGFGSRCCAKQVATAEVERAIGDYGEAKTAVSTHANLS